MASLLAVSSLSCEMLPNFSQQTPQLTPSSSAQTQNFSDEQISNYAKAVLEIETHRQKAYKNIQNILGSSPPDITCNQPDSFKTLPKEAQGIAVDYCVTSKQIIENSSLTNEDFNTITVRLRTDKDLKMRIQNAMIRIQRKQKK